MHVSCVSAWLGTENVSTAIWAMSNALSTWHMGKFVFVAPSYPNSCYMFQYLIVLNLIVSAMIETRVNIFRPRHSTLFSVWFYTKHLGIEFPIMLYSTFRIWLTLQRLTVDNINIYYVRFEYIPWKVIHVDTLDWITLRQNLADGSGDLYQCCFDGWLIFMDGRWSVTTWYFW